MSIDRHLLLVTGPPELQIHRTENHSQRMHTGSWKNPLSRTPLYSYLSSTPVTKKHCCHLQFAVLN
ncbi:hypothetical protein BT93_J0007 [Corymbia citriodora subsp. variegata]|nr:hypothetical protein BT93_J0007 [Corymbia citriodora subsp. variegata]